MKIRLNCGSAPIGFPKPILAYAFAVKGVPNGIPAFDEEYEYVDDTDIPVALSVFSANFHRYRALGGTITLIPGETLGDRVIDPGDIDNSVPMALSRANKVNIFENL